jgi:hypothetical protein
MLRWRLTTRQRQALSETVRELANLAAGALVLGQFVGEQAASPGIIVAGALIWLVFVSFALVLNGED